MASKIRKGDKVMVIAGAQKGSVGTVTRVFPEFDKVIVEAFKFILEGAAFYNDRYVRTDDGWKIAHTGYRRTFEQTYSLDDLPSMKVGGPGTATYAETE